MIDAKNGHMLKENLYVFQGERAPGGLDYVDWVSADAIVVSESEWADWAGEFPTAVKKVALDGGVETLLAKTSSDGFIASRIGEDQWLITDGSGLHMVEGPERHLIAEDVAEAELWQADQS